MKSARAVVAALLALILTGSAQEWTRFRGPNGTGLSAAKTIPTKWTEADFNWKTDLPGIGHSSPVLWGEKVFVTACDEQTGRFSVICLNTANGSILWQKQSPLARHDKHNLNSFATSTPTVDADRVYVCRTEPTRVTLSAFTHSGEPVWEKDLGPLEANHGGGTSPIVHDGMVILADEQDGASFLIAMDTRTGETRWKTPRTTSNASYSTPCVYQPRTGKAVLIFNSQAHGISAVAPDTGKMVWEFAKAFDKRSVSSPILIGDFILGSCGSGGGGNVVTAINAARATPERKPELAWRMKQSAPYVPTGIALGDRVWLWSDAGILSQVDAATGAIRYQERVGGNYFGSPIWIDGRLFCVSTAGELVVVDGGDAFKVLHRHALNETCHSTPAVALDQLFIRTENHLWSSGSARKSASLR